jgi:hypothetical protein
VRAAPLYNLKQGINRLRVKGGANPSSLYDLVNAYITTTGSIQPREGTIRVQTLDGTTKGLMASDGIFNVFSNTLEAVPSGYVDNVLIDPNDPTQAIETIWFAKPFMGFPYVVAEFANGDVFHYWLQNSGTWAPDTVYQVGNLVLPKTTPTGLAYLATRVSAVNPLWQPETQITLNTIVEPTEATGYQYKAVAVAGATPHTSSTEPVWPTVSAGTIQEFGDFDTSATDAGTTQGTTASTAQPLATTITDRYGDSSTVASSGAAPSSSLVLPTTASTKVTTWKKGTLYAPGAVVQPTTGQGAFLNAIPNGDFENGNDGNWVLTSGVTFNTANEYQGDECLQFTAANSNQTATMSTFGVVTPGQKVTATVYVNPNNSGANMGMGISLRWYDASDTFLNSINGPVNEGEGYRLTSVTGTAPASAVHCRVQLFGGNGGSSHTGFADLVSWSLETPAAVSNFLYEAVQATAAASGSSEPTWPTTAGETVVDGGVTWEAIGTSIITWEAIPIMLSGAVEPTWPTTVPVAVLDASTFKDLNGNEVVTSISWVANSRQITDVNCPQTIGAALGASHVFAIDKDIVEYSAAVNPTDWTSANNAGYLPTGLNNYGDNPAAVLALYRSNLMVFNAGGYQMWQIDPDPANMAILDAQPVGSIYTRAAQSVSNDLLFLTEVGVRNLGTVGATANMQVGNSGQPVDPLVLAQIQQLTPSSLAIEMIAGHSSVDATIVGFAVTLYGSAAPNTFTGADGGVYQIDALQTDGAGASNSFQLDTVNIAAPLNSNKPFQTISFTDKNGNPQSFDIADATVTGGQYVWANASGALFTSGNSYAVTLSISNASPQPISLYYPGRGQYWLIFGPQAFVFTVNGQGLRTWSRYIFPDVITDWTLNAGILYLRSAGNLVWQFDAGTLVDDSGGANVVFDGVIQTPYVDVGPLGINKELIGIDLVGTGEVIIQLGWAQNDLTTFNDNAGFDTSLNVTPPYTLDAADTVPGQPLPFPMTAPSFTLILTFPGNQAWSWQASNLYLQDASGGGATG